VIEMATLGALTAILQLKNNQFLKGISESVSAIDGLSKKASAAGKISGAIGTVGAVGLGTFAGAATVAVGSIAAVTKGLTDMAMEAQAMPAVESAFDGLAASFGTSGQTMLKSLQEGSNGMISNMDLMKSFNLGAQLVGRDFAETLPDAFGYLGKVSASTGESMGYMLDSLVKGVGRLSPMILDNLGIQVSLTEAYDEWALTNGRTVESMTKSEQQAAVMAKTMALLAENTAAMPDIADLASTKIAGFKTTITNLKNELGVAFLPVLTDFLGTLGGLAQAALPSLIPMVKLLGGGLTKLSDVLTPVLKDFSGFVSGIGNVAKAFQEGDITGASLLASIAIGQLGKNLGKSAKTFIETGTSMVMGLVEGIAGAIPMLMQVATGLVDTLLSSFADNITEMMSIGFEIVSNLINGIAAAMPMILEHAANILVGFIQGIIEGLPMLIEAGINMISGIVEGLLAALPILIQAAPALILGLVEGLLQGINAMLEAGSDIVAMLSEGLTIAIPLLAEAAVAIVLGLVNMIVNNLPMIIESAVQLVLALVDGILANLPLLLDAAWQIVSGIAIGLYESRGEILTAGKSIATSLFDGIVSLLAKLVGAGGQLVTAVVSGISNGISPVIAAASNVITNVITTIKGYLSNLTAAGNEIITAFKGGFANGMVAVFQLATSIGLGIINTIKGFVGDLIGVGGDLIAGLAQGITGRLQSLLTTVSDLVGNIVDKVKELFGVGSPSKVFMKIGEDLNRGLALGIKQSTHLPEREIAYDFNTLEAEIPTYTQNNYTLNMPTTADSSNVQMAFRMMEALG